MSVGYPPSLPARKFFPQGEDGGCKLGLNIPVEIFSTK